MLKMEIEDLNPWWVSGKVQKEFLHLGKRDTYEELLQYATSKQIIVLTGLRRTGKTVTLHQVIDHLLQKNPKDTIIYYSYDLLDQSIEEALEYYNQILKKDFRKDKVTVFIDEIQKRDNWENELKLLYDNYPNLKFFISGSASLFIEKKTKESLAGRTYSFIMQPLSFAEYLRLKRVNYDSNPALYGRELKKQLILYLQSGGFPELLHEEDAIKIQKYVKESVADKIIYADIPNAFEIEEPGLLESIFSIVSASPGMVIDYESLASDLKRNRKTISNYLLYLEKAFLVRKLYNYSRNLLTNEKKLKRFYPSSTAFAYLHNADMGQITETAVLMNKQFRYFSRKGNKEVDFVSEDASPTEMKYAENIRRKELSGFFSFIEKEGAKRGIVITKDTEKTEGGIRYVPLWKWLLS
jgi:hypothetical protein